MNIQPVYVTFEQAKLLKEKGFDVIVKHWYEYALTSQKDKDNGYSGSFGWKKGECNLQSGYFQNNSTGDLLKCTSWFLCAAPEQHQVIEWFEIKYQKYVYAFKYNRTWHYKIDAEHGTDYFSTGKGYDSRKQAYSAAIDYVLKELI